MFLVRYRLKMFIAIEYKFSKQLMSYDSFVPFLIAYWLFVIENMLCILSKISNIKLVYTVFFIEADWFVKQWKHTRPVQQLYTVSRLQAGCVSHYRPGFIDHVRYGWNTSPCGPVYFDSLRALLTHSTSSFIFTDTFDVFVSCMSL